MNDPNLIPVLYMPKLHGRDRRCEMCGWPFRKGESTWKVGNLLACRGDQELCKIRLSLQAAQLLVDAEEAILTQGELI